ncbi:MAG TPA: cytochrome c maturation protein CcmE [Candidatus Methanoperedenaceae archaeon]|nr:cytochrome c maturation protein CcmE [Candidatus Methanoperedenaceae archaeon]
MQKAHRLALGAAVVAVLLVYLALSSFGGYAQYMTVSEVLSKRPDSMVNINGTVVPGTVVYEPLKLTFRMTDGNETIDVLYKSSKPDNFNEGMIVVVSGRYNGTVFDASAIYVKCPSKYESGINTSQDTNQT